MKRMSVYSGRIHYFVDYDIQHEFYRAVKEIVLSILKPGET
jgi:hypothetical protein